MNVSRLSMTHEEWMRIAIKLASVRGANRQKVWKAKCPVNTGYAFNGQDLLIEIPNKPGYKPSKGFIKKHLWGSFKGAIGDA